MDQASCFPRGSPFWILPPLPRVALSNRGYQQTNSITSRSTNDFKCHSGPLSWPVCRLCIPFDFVVVVVVWPTPPFVFSLDGRPTIRPRYRGRAREESSCSTVAAGTSSSSLLFFLARGFLSRWDEEEVIFSFSSCRFNQIKWKKRNSFDYCLLVVSVSLERVVGFSKILFALFFFFRIVNVDASSPGEIFF